jgi:Restriction endonuclease
MTERAQMVGQKSGVKRQIDVLIDARHDTDNSRRIIVDAKLRKRKIDVNDVETFRGLMADVNATHDYLVTSSGPVIRRPLKACPNGSIDSNHGSFRKRAPSVRCARDRGRRTVPSPDPFRTLPSRGRGTRSGGQLAKQDMDIPVEFVPPLERRSLSRAGHLKRRVVLGG